MKTRVIESKQFLRASVAQLILAESGATSDKILSLYEPDLHVIVRNKADAEVEFGNTLLLAERMKDRKFRSIQKRRAQTEDRIGILKNDFLGRPLRSKGFQHRELAVTWAVFAHNIRLIAGLPQKAALHEAA